MRVTKHLKNAIMASEIFLGPRPFLKIFKNHSQNLEVYEKVHLILYQVFLIFKKVLKIIILVVILMNCEVTLPRIASF